LPGRDRDRLSVALIGFGGSGAGLHRPLITANPGLRLDVIVTRDPARAERARLQCPEARVTSDPRVAAECAIAVVALPPQYRGDLVAQLADRGTRVVVEKPMAANPADAARLVASVPEPMLTIFQNRRWDSDFLTLRRLAAEGVWSGPVRLESRIQWWQPAVHDTWRNSREGGGILLEVGTHLVDQAILLAGPVSAVYAELDVRRPGAVAEDDVFVALEHEDGSRSHLWAGPAGDPTAARFRLVGPDVQITLGTPDRQQTQLAGGMTPGAEGWGVTDPSDWIIRRAGSAPAPVAPEPGDSQTFYDRVAAWAAGDGAPPVTAAEGLAIMRVIGAARRSSAESRLVHLTEGY
jgi:scyllo-inositol 2-dehydrogenase (NADP+)